MKATLSRGTTSVDFFIDTEAPDPVVIQTVGKPELEFKQISGEDPRVSDQFSDVQTFIVDGYLESYADARTLAEELIKQHSDGNPMALDLSNLSGFSSYQVSPNTESAAELEYLPGQRNWVNLSLQLTRVDETIGGAASGDTSSSFNTPGNGGSVTIKNPGTGQSVTLTHDLRVTRTVGRPNRTVRADPEDVTDIDKVRSAFDEWQIEGELISDTARADSRTLIEDILGAKRGRDGLKLSFNNNLYGLGTYTVAAAGSEAGRRVVTAGERGTATIRNLTLRTITT